MLKIAAPFEYLLEMGISLEKISSAEIDYH